MPDERRRETDWQFEGLTKIVQALALKVDVLGEKLDHKVSGMAVVQAEIKKDVSHTLEQVIKTNGRVTDLEEDVDLLDNDHRQLRQEHDEIKHKALGWAAGVSGIIAILVKIFWK